jgi:hypothetical protein
VTSLDHALYYAARGWRVVPIPPGHKHPKGIKDWQNKATTDIGRISRYWTTNPDHGVGIATGPESGFFALDIDPDHGGDDSLAALEAKYGSLPDTIESLTGGGGRHLPFAWVPGLNIQNNQSGKLGAGIDVRGINGQIVVAPTVHPGTGRQYCWEVEHDPFDGVAVADAPQWLLDLLAADIAATEPRRPKRVRLVGDLMPGDWWAAQTSWPDELARYGWTLHSIHNDAAGSYYELWTRPGKAIDAGASASLYYQGSDVLKVFTSSAAPLQADETYTLWGFHVAMEHGGDFAAAARLVRAQMPNTSSDLSPSPSTTTSGDAAIEANSVHDDVHDTNVDDWTPIDLRDIAARIRAGEFEATVPTVLAVEGGMPLFYAERINSLFGESGGGKTWAALAAITEVVRMGGSAALIDYEDNANGITERLVLLGLTDDEIARVDYRNPTSGIAAGHERLVADAAHFNLIVIDSTGEAMASGGIDSNADNEVALWFAIVKRLSRLPGGPAVIVLDHVPKDKDAPSAYAIGSQRKRAAVTGAAYRVDTLIEPARGKQGKLKLTVAKDRLGNRPKGSVACELHIKSSDGGVLIEAHLSDAAAAAAAGQAFRPTVLMERVSKYLEAMPAASKRQVEANVQGKNEGIRLALDCLVEDGFVTLGPLGYKVENPYRDGVDNVQPRPAPQPRPTAPQGALQGTAPRAPGITNQGRGAHPEGPGHSVAPLEVRPDVEGRTSGERAPVELAPEEPF